VNGDAVAYHHVFTHFRTEGALLGALLGAIRPGRVSADGNSNSPTGKSANKHRMQRLW
jgi:hypothetical protein